MGPDTLQYIPPICTLFCWGHIFSWSCYWNWKTNNLVMYPSFLLWYRADDSTKIGKKYLHEWCISYFWDLWPFPMFTGPKTIFTKYCLTEWISKLLGSFGIHWVRQCLVNLVGLVDVGKWKYLQDWANYHRFQAWQIVLIFNTVMIWYV